MKVVNHLSQGLETLKSSWNKLSEATKPGKLNRTSIQGLAPVGIKKNLFSALKGNPLKALRDRVITKPPHSEVKAIMQAQPEDPKATLKSIQKTITREDNKELAKPQKNLPQLKNRVINAKNAVKLAESLQQGAAQLAKSEQLNQNLADYSLENRQTSEFGQHPLQVHHQAKSLVNKKRAELKRARGDLEKYENAQNSKSNLTKEANGLIDKVNKLNAQKTVRQDETLKSHETHLKKLSAQKRKLKAAVVAEEKILKSIPHKEKKHEYKLFDMKKKLQYSIESAKGALKQLEEDIKKAKLSLQSAKISEQLQKLQAKQNKVDNKLGMFQAEPANAAPSTPTPRVKKQAPEPPTSSSPAYVQRPTPKRPASKPTVIELSSNTPPKKVKRQAPLPPIANDNSIVSKTNIQLNPPVQPELEFDPLDSILNNLDFCSQGMHDNPNITQEQLKDIELQVDKAIDNESINLNSLDAIFRDFLDAVDQEHQQNGATVYHGGERLTQGFKRGLDLIKQGHSYEDARNAFYQTLSSTSSSTVYVQKSSLKTPAPKTPVIEPTSNTPPKKVKRQAPLPPIANDNSIVSKTNIQLNPPVQPELEFDPLDSILNNLDFCSQGMHDNPNITQEQLKDIELQVNSAIDNESINLNSLDAIFRDFLDAVDQEYQQNGTTVYHGGERLTQGFKRGLDLIKQGHSYEDARNAFYQTLSSN